MSVFISITRVVVGVPLCLSVVLATSAPRAASADEPSAGGDRFDLMLLKVDGNTVLNSVVIEKTVYPFLGPDKNIEDVEGARGALENAYREAGYPTVLVEIPEQEIVDGLVRLQVIEGSVERLRITGSRYHALAPISAEVPALAAGKVPHMPSVQKQMSALARQSSDRTVTPVFRAGRSPGKTEVELRVADSLPLHGAVEINSRNSEFTSRSRVVGSLRYDNLWQRFHSASLQYQVSPENPSEVDVWSGTYVMPTGWWDTRLVGYGIDISSNTELGVDVGGTSVVGTGMIFGGRVLKPLGVIDTYIHNLTVGFDYKDFDQGIGIAGNTGQSTPISYTTFQLGYEASNRAPGRTTSLSSTLHVAMRGLGNDQAQFDDKRVFSSAAFLYFTLDLKHLQELPADFRLAGRLAGQVADSPLISNEQFAAGGPQSVRGYHQTQQLGDDGINLSLELQSPALGGPIWSDLRDFRAHVFLDYAYLWIQQPLGANPAYYRLAGTGVGFRLKVRQHLFGEFDWALPLYPQSTIEAGDPRIDFRLGYEF